MKRKIAYGGLLAVFAVAALASAAHAGPKLPGTGTPVPAPTCMSAATIGTPVIFAVAHPDDETLAMAVPIAEHAGQDVHVLFLTSGGASSAINMINGTQGSTWWGGFHDPAAEGYAPLTLDQFKAAREAEAYRAVSALTCPARARVHFARLDDGQVTVADAKAAILALADSLTEGPVRLKGHSYITQVEPHADHRAIGNAIQALGTADPARFGDRRFYVLPHSWDYVGYLPSRAWDYPASADINARVEAASDVYKAWNPPVSYAIGWHSVPGYFTTVVETPKALVHR